MKPCFIAIFTTAITFLCCKATLFAQVCNGAFGDPVVNVTFGSGANPGQQLNPGVTTYNFTNNTCPDDGFYTIANNSVGCFGNSWHSLASDHTPNDTNGFMMIVNASYTPGDFYVDTVRDLCAFTTYEFGAWITNVLTPTSFCVTPISPKLVFSIETVTGTVLGTFSTGDIPSSNVATWQQYKLFFTTPLNTSDIVLRLTNSAPGGCGNDLALDDITFRPCGPSVITSLGNNPQNSFDLCYGTASAMPITAVLGSGFVSPSLQWQTSGDSGKTWMDIAGATSLSYQFTGTQVGTYQYRLSVAEGTNIGILSCRVASNPITITIYDAPAITASVNSPVCENELLSFVATGGNGYTWTGPMGFSSTLANPTLTAAANRAGQYLVTATDSIRCVGTAVVNVVINPSPIATISGMQLLCEGDSVQLQAGGGTSYNWLPTAGLSSATIANPIASPPDTTRYAVVVSNTNNCRDTASIILYVIAPPVANAGPDKFLLKGMGVTLEGFVSGSAIDINWSPAATLDNPTLATPTARPLIDTRYTLTVVSDAGCGIATDDVYVIVYNDIYVPSAFSPNNDRLNDKWRIPALAADPTARVVVYNRFGKVVFQSTGNAREWDGTYNGKPLPTGAYAYLLELKNGSAPVKGMVMLVR